MNPVLEQLSETYGFRLLDAASAAWSIFRASEGYSPENLDGNGATAIRLTQLTPGTVSTLLESLESGAIGIAQQADAVLIDIGGRLVFAMEAYVDEGSRSMMVASLESELERLLGGMHRILHRRNLTLVWGDEGVQFTP